MAFDIEKALQAWRKQLQQSGRVEPGLAEELEANLHDRYEEYLIRGLEPEPAFEAAKKRVLPPDGPDYRAFESSAQSRPWYAFWKSTFAFILPNYLKIASRNLRRKGFYNTINYVCLSIGILTTALALLYLDYETSYDQFVPGVAQKYRMGRTFRSQDYSVISFNGYYGAAPEVQMKQINGLREVQGVRSACHFFTFGQPELLRINGKELPTEDLLHTNTPQAFFDFFQWPFVLGSAEAFSQDLNTALLTEKQAERFFGKDWKEEELLGQTLSTTEEDYTIVGVIEDLPPNAHFDFSIALHRDKIAYWGSRTYLELAAGVSVDAVRQRIDDNMGNINTNLADSELFGGTILQPLTSIHLNSDMLYELKPPGDKRYLYIIGVISAIILLLTVSNYTNLSIAMNAGRSREIGMRKLFGASVGQVSNQFLLEAIFLSFLTLPVVLLGLWWLLPRFDTFMGTALTATVLDQPWLLIVLVGLSLIVGLFSSLYPAVFLARQRIIHLFRGNAARTAAAGLSTRKAIITFQFVLLIGLCSLTLLVNQQLQFIQRADLGFDKNQVLYVNLSEDSSRFEVFRNELLKIPEVTDVGSGSPLGRNPFNQTTYKLAGTDQVFDDAYDISLDYSAVDILNIETSVPEYINDPEQAPKSVVLINETLAQKLMNQFGLSREALIGQTIIEEPEYTDEETGEVGFPFSIAGTFKDINMFSLRERVTPMFLTVYKDPGYVRWASIGYQGLSPSAIIEAVKTRYEALNLDKAFVHSFLSQNIEELYQKEQRIAKLSIYFSLTAFLVAIIGLIALTAFLTTLKRKEIGIRKILGASHRDILLRFNREYVLLIGIALLVAAPLAYLGVQEWLSGFAYRITVQPAVFLLAGLITLLVSVIAVSFMVVRVLQSAPVKALREEQ
jgi:putative ABC transport system permease protein